MNTVAPSGLPLIAAIAVAPRATMRWMLDHPERRQSFAVVMAASVSWAMRDLSLGDLVEAGEMLGVSTAMVIALAALAAGILFSLLVFFFFSAAAMAAGRYLLGGTGTFGEVRTAVAWGLAPQVWAMVYRLPMLLLWPETVAVVTQGGRRLRIKPEEPIDIVFHETAMVPLVIFLLLELLTLCWYLWVGSAALGEAHKFSTARGLANLLIAVILPFVVTAVIVAAAYLAIATT